MMASATWLGTGDGARRRLAPSNLELLAMEGELFDGGIRMKCRGSGTIQEGKENARLFGEDADGL